MTLSPLIPVQNAVRAQFANPPALESVARQMLAAAIAQHYPSLQIDLERTRLAVPDSQGSWSLQPFMGKVLDYLGRGIELDWRPINGQQFYLTDNAPDWLRPEGGELDMKVIATLIQELSWRLPIGLQTALSDFWGEPSDTGISRWAWLSDTLKDTLRMSALLQPDLSDRAREVIQQVINAPVFEERIRQYGEQAVHAYWLQPTLVDQKKPAGTPQPSRIVLVSADTVLAYRPDGSTRAYRSLDSLSRAWGRQISRAYRLVQIRFQRFELDANVFDAMAAALLNRQLDRLGALKLPASIGWQELQNVYASITDPAHFFARALQASQPTMTAFATHLPHWLRDASPADKARYRHYSLALAAEKKIGKGRTFLHGISDIRTFTVGQLHRQMRADQLDFEKDTPVHAFGELFEPDEIELTFLTTAGLPGALGIVEPVTMSLTDLALKNLVGRPKGQLSVRHRQGFDLPPWLTPEYITRRGGLIEKVDIGKTYPQRLEDWLLGNPDSTREREQLFAAHLRAYLPLQALELSLRQENGMTSLGARYVAAVVQANADDQRVGDTTVVIRHLALVRQPQARPDVVTNMFIIEPADIEQGPHVLYRPFYPDALFQFSTRMALFDAIAEPGELQASVLTWLSDTARPIYDNGGFKEPHYVRFGLGSEFAPIETPAPARLATNGISNELLQYLQNGQLTLFLYGCNARALVEQANAESVSNNESRWAVLLEGGGLLFNSLILLPALPPPLMLTAGLLGMVNLASQDIPALSSNDPTTRELAAADVLLNVGMLLLHQAATALPRPGSLAEGLMARALRPRAPVQARDIWPEPALPEIVTGIVALPGERPDPASNLLDFSFASARNRLTPDQEERLAAFAVERPDTLPAAQPDGPQKGLYRIGQTWHAMIDHTLYPVDVDASGGAVIVSATDATHYGPGLKSDSLGNWSLDLRLRLQGGMPPRRIAALQQKMASRINQLNAQLTDFYPREAPLRRTVEITHQALKSAEADPRFTATQLAAMRDKLGQALLAEQQALQALLDTTEERIELKIPFAEVIVISILEKIFDNSNIAMSISAGEQHAILQKWPQFTSANASLEVAADQDPAGFTQFVRDQVALNERAIERIELRNSCLDRLYALSEAGAAAAGVLAEGIPAEGHTNLSLKAFQLDFLKVASSSPSVVGLTEYSLDKAIDPLREHIHTHNALNIIEFDSSKRVEILGSLVDHYGQAVDALQGIGIVYADELNPEYFDKLRALLISLYQDATRQLASEIKPGAATTSKRPRKPPPSASGGRTRKMISVRGKGKLIGELRPADNEWHKEVIEVRSGYDKHLLSTYLQHGEEWVEIKAERPASAPHIRALNVIKGEARNLFGQYEGHLRKAMQYKTLSRHPQEVEELLSHEALKLDRLATEMHFALQALPGEARLAEDQMLIDKMRDASRRMIREGKAMRIQLSLELPPTHGNLQYLIDQELVQVSRLGKRIQLAGERRDFIQEYAVNDRQGRPLWYAHFHYPEAGTPKQSYTVAHLKTKAQRTHSYWSLLAAAKSGQAVINVHRGQIGKTLAEHWFLPLAD